MKDQIVVGTEIVDIYSMAGEHTESISYPTARYGKTGGLSVHGSRGYVIDGEPASYAGDGMSCQLNAFDFPSQTHLWETNLGFESHKSEQIYPPYVTDDMILCAVGNRISSIDNSGVTNWTASLKGGLTATPTKLDTSLFCGVHTGDKALLQQIAAGDGKTISTTRVDTPISFCTTTDSTLLIGTDRGKVRSYEVRR